MKLLKIFVLIDCCLYNLVKKLCPPPPPAAIAVFLEDMTFSKFQCSHLTSV